MDVKIDKSHYQKSTESDNYEAVSKILSMVLHDGYVENNPHKEVLLTIIPYDVPPATVAIVDVVFKLSERANQPILLSCASRVKGTNLYNIKYTVLITPEDYSAHVTNHL